MADTQAALGSEFSIRAVLVSEKNTAAELKQISLADLPDEEVLVSIDYSTLNYKDALAVTGKGICRALPMVCGIDLAGVVEESRSDLYKSGDRVLVNGYGLSELHWGGYAQKQKLKPEWLVAVPDKFSNLDVMALGTAGYTAMLCVNAIRDAGVSPEDGPVLVTGASGGVGSVAIMLLSTLGYEVAAVTGSPKKAGDFLKNLGAQIVIARSEFDRASKPLEKELWAAVVDATAGDILTTAISQIKYNGVVAACGMAASTSLSPSVFPFILRGVTLRGVDSVMASHEDRVRAWNDLSQLIDLEQLGSIYSVEEMTDIVALSEKLLTGDIQGRIVIDVKK